MIFFLFGVKFHLKPISRPSTTKVIPISRAGFRVVGRERFHLQIHFALRRKPDFSAVHAEIASIHLANPRQCFRGETPLSQGAERGNEGKRQYSPDSKAFSYYISFNFNKLT
jgi:hypothetical protein